MLSTLFRWELRSLRRDPALGVAVLLCLGAIGFAVANGARWADHLGRVGATALAADAAARGHARELAAKLDAENNTTSGAWRNPRDPAGYANRVMSHFATLPATAVAALSTGQSDLLPTVLPLAPATNPALAGSAEPENPHRLLVGRFDAAFVIVHLAPLLIIALTYALLAGERERGTLALVLAQPLRPGDFLLGRLAPRLLLGLVLLGALALAFGALPGGGGLRGILWFTVALAYGAFWFALALAVAVRPGPSARHALVLVALWLGFVVLAPAGINLAVKTLHPVPSRVALILALRQATDAASANRSQVLAGYYEDHPELAPPGAGAAEDFTLLRVATTHRVEQDLAPVLARYEAQLARQQALVGRLAFLSPALLAHTALADAAGTGLARHRDFVRQAATHQAELRAFFTPRIARKERFAAWDEVPVFQFAEEPARSLAARLWPAVLALLAAAAALTARAWFSLRHSTITS
jgi:ABC-2 type transport system permease protein